MGCGCGCSSVVYTPCTTVPVNCSEACGSVVINNSWNIPACSASATLSTTNLKNVLVGSYLFSPTYGYFKITSFNAVTGELAVTNECQSVNAAAGTIVPAYTLFSIGVPPADTGWLDWTPTLTPLAPMTLTGTSIVQAKYNRNTASKTVDLNVYINTTTVAAASSAIDISLPINISGANSYLVGTGAYTGTSTALDSIYIYRNGASSTLLTIARRTVANYDIGATTIRFTASYIGV